MSRGTKNKIEDLRNHLFAALEALGDDEKPMEIERARAISEVAQTIINSAKVEIDYLRVTGGQRAPTNFLPDGDTAERGDTQPPRMRAIGSR